MANKVINIGTQTTNLLSNDNLIVYRDISMISKFNVGAASTTEDYEPDENDYYDILATEQNYMNENGQLNTDRQLKIKICYNYKDDKVSCLHFHIDDKYLIDKKKYVNKLSLSKYRVEKNINVKAVQDSLHNIFTWIPGERVLNPEFGSILYRYLYSGITEYNTEQIIAEIRKCISEYEPRVKLEQVKNISTVDDTENNTVHLELIYTIPSLNSEQYSYTYIYHKKTI